MKTKIFIALLAAGLICSLAGNFHLWRELDAHRVQSAIITAELELLLEADRAHMAELQVIAAQQEQQRSAAQQLLVAVKENGEEMDRLRAENDALRNRPAAVIVRNIASP